MTNKVVFLFFAMLKKEAKASYHLAAFVYFLNLKKIKLGKFTQNLNFKNKNKIICIFSASLSSGSCQAFV